MPDRPDALELIEAVLEFLSEELLPTFDDHRLKFRTLVAMNALAIARRELEASDNLSLSHEEVTELALEASDNLSLSQDELGELARRIRAGDPPDGALRLLKEHVAAKLRISNPAYLERYE
jgi:hypothetical protein